jgi:hypothetical protein
MPRFAQYDKFELFPLTLDDNIQLGAGNIGYNGFIFLDFNE